MYNQPARKTTDISTSTEPMYWFKVWIHMFDDWLIKQTSSWDRNTLSGFSLSYESVCFSPPFYTEVNWVCFRQHRQSQPRQPWVWKIVRKSTFQKMCDISGPNHFQINRKTSKDLRLMKTVVSCCSICICVYLLCVCVCVCNPTTLLTNWKPNLDLSLPHTHFR